MSRRWPGWRTLPCIEIAPLAEQARMQGELVKRYSYVWNVPAQNYVTTCGWQVHPDGTVSVLGEALSRCQAGCWASVASTADH